MPAAVHGIIAVLLAAIVGVTLLAAVPARAAPPARGTGDAWVDATLLDVERYAARYPDAFSDELVRYHGAPRALVEQLLQSGRWRAGDIYFACALGQAAGQPCRRVVELHDAEAGQAWNAIARELGVAPGSRGFQRLKRALVDSYGRWARPLQLDASLHEDYPKLPWAPTPAPAPAAAPASPSSAGKHAPAGKAPAPATSAPATPGGHGA